MFDVLNRLPDWLRQLLALAVGAVLLFLVGMLLMADGTIDPDRATTPTSEPICRNLTGNESELVIDSCADAAGDR